MTADKRIGGVAVAAAQPGLGQGSARRKGREEKIIETIASGLGNTVAFAAEIGILFVIFAVLWAAFAYGLI
jgi:hypothetical protein